MTHLLGPYGLALLGGALLGTSASLLLYLHGRVAGIAGLYAGVLLPDQDARQMRVLFLGGLVAAALIASIVLGGDAAAVASAPTLPIALVSGLLVGYGARLGNGCSSGHGICGVSRLSTRSLASTATFVGTAMLTVACVRLLGGAR